MDASAVFDQVAPFSDEPLVNITKAIQDSVSYSMPIYNTEVILHRAREL